MVRTTLSTARTEFASALNQICAERGITPESVLETIKAAILAAYRKDFTVDEELEYEVEIDPETGAAKIFRYLKDNKKEKEDITPPGFGRIAAQTAKQVILQRIRETEKAAIIDEYKDRVGQLINGMVLRFDGKDIIVDLGRGQGRMPPSEQILLDGYRLNKRLTFYILDIRETMRGREIIVSRAAKELVVKLFKREVPEVASGAVEIKKIAREPGSRSKIAVVSTQVGVDPVGSCVGQRGVRVQAVIEELNGEKIDVIPYNLDPVKFITAALSPAENLTVEVNEKKKTAVVMAPDDQLSLAIGKEGQNVRLAGQLAGYKIDIRGKEEKRKVSASASSSAKATEDKKATADKEKVEKKQKVKKKAKKADKKDEK